MTIINPFAKIRGIAEYRRLVNFNTYDLKVFPQCCNKIEEVGKIKKKKFVIICDGNGKMTIEEIKSKKTIEDIQSKMKILEEFKRLKDKGVITKDEFKRKKKKLLKEL